MELLTFVLDLLIAFVLGMIIGRSTISRRLGFLVGVLAGAVFFLIIFLVSFIASYPGTLVENRATTGSLGISFLLLCLWSMGEGLVSLSGTWVATVRHSRYLKPVGREE